MKNCLVPERLAARFTRANSEYLSRANHANFSGHANGWWIALWFRVTIAFAGHTGMRLWDTSAAGSGVLLTISGTHGKIGVNAYGAVSDSPSVYSVLEAAVDEWHFLYVDYDGAALRLQLDDAVPVSGVYADYVASAQALNIGRRLSGADYFDGEMQCVMCGHPNILTAAEIAWLYSEGSKQCGGETGFDKTPFSSYPNQTCWAVQVARYGAYGNGVGITAKTTSCWPLQEESNGTGAQGRGEAYGLTLTDNNTVTSERGLVP